MELTLETFLIVCPLIFLAGFVDSIGGGGGLISLPAYLFAGLPAHMALATNKLSSSIGTSISALRLFRHMDLPLVGVSIVCSLIGSSFGSMLALSLNEQIIKFLLIPVLPLVAYYVLRKKNLESSSEGIKPSRKKSFFLAMIISFFIGGWDGFYGPGTGTFLLLLYTGLIKMDVVTASANTRAVNLASNVGALAVFIANGKVLYTLGLPAALFCIAGNYLGSGLVLKNGSRIVRPVILVVLAILFLKILLDF